MSASRFAFAFVCAFGISTLGASCNKANTAPPNPPPSVTQEPHSADGASTPTTGTAVPPASTAGDLITQVNGLDAAPLRNATMRETFWAVANDELSPCGDPHSLAACARDNTCNLCMPALKFLMREIVEGYPAQQIGELVRARYAKTAVMSIRSEGSPVRGDVAAPVTLLEFSDYECPHCGVAAPILKKVEEKFPHQLRVIHMHFPLGMHPNALAASKAAIAAGKQGKFWEYHDLLFANQRTLDAAHLDTFATQLGLNLTQFHTDMNAQATADKIQADRREGERLQINGTPSIYINGRVYTLEIGETELVEWIKDELEMPH